MRAPERKRLCAAPTPMVAGRVRRRTAQFVAGERARNSISPGNPKSSLNAVNSTWPPPKETACTGVAWPTKPTISTSGLPPSFETRIHDGRSPKGVSSVRSHAPSSARSRRLCMTMHCQASSDAYSTTRAVMDHASNSIDRHGREVLPGKRFRIRRIETHRGGLLHVLSRAAIPAAAGTRCVCWKRSRFARELLPDAPCVDRGNQVHRRTWRARAEVHRVVELRSRLRTRRRQAAHIGQGITSQITQGFEKSLTRSGFTTRKYSPDTRSTTTRRQVHAPPARSRACAKWSPSVRSHTSAVPTVSGTCACSSTCHAPGSFCSVVLVRAARAEGAKRHRHPRDPLCQRRIGNQCRGNVGGRAMTSTVNGCSGVKPCDLRQQKVGGSTRLRRRPAGERKACSSSSGGCTAIPSRCSTMFRRMRKLACAEGSGRLGACAERIPRTSNAGSVSSQTIDHWSSISLPTSVERTTGVGAELVPCALTAIGKRAFISNQSNRTSSRPSCHVKARLQCGCEVSVVRETSWCGSPRAPV